MTLKITYLVEGKTDSATVEASGFSVDSGVLTIYAPVAPTVLTPAPPPTSSGVVINPATPEWPRAITCFAPGVWLTVREVEAKE